MRTLRLCFVIAFVVFLRSSLISQIGPCPVDTTVGIGFANIVHDSLRFGFPLPCFPSCASSEIGQWSATIPDGNGILYLGGVNGHIDSVLVVITNGCGMVVFAECRVLDNQTPPMILVTANEFQNNIITVYGPIGYPVNAMLDTVSSPQFPMFGPPFVNLDTLCGALSAPCPIDTLHAFQGPPSVVDVATDCDSIECYNASCGGAHTSTIVVDSLFSGCIYVIGDSSTVSLIVRTTLDSIVLDTCISVIDDTTFGYRFCADVGGYYMTICAFDTLNYSFLGVYSGASLPFPSNIVATVGCPATEIDSPQSEFHECQWQNVFGEFKEIPLPLGMWHCRGCRRKIVVRNEWGVEKD